MWSLSVILYPVSSKFRRKPHTITLQVQTIKTFNTYTVMMDFAIKASFDKSLD